MISSESSGKQGRRANSQGSDTRKERGKTVHLDIILGCHPAEEGRGSLLVINIGNLMMFLLLFGQGLDHLLDWNSASFSMPASHCSPSRSRVSAPEMSEMSSLLPMVLSISDSINLIN
ncbi:hypothetical protein PGIGA_G00253020 [Pangasianodon gigas]|uniref:Uncharacterized protein n=1 Tax=Pangasianodon gigas TaxID=30993 RepID=A0ACC5WQY9_PANGG|nr:hypothetical protein [Pangasianodon gigas]